MQRIVAVAGGVKSYCRDPAQVLTEANCSCPFCETVHQLRRHGWYKRFANFPSCASVQIMIWRLYCPNRRQTVSLLPDFCLPRRQQGPATLAVFLIALIFQKLTLAKALLLSRFDLREDIACPDIEIVSLHSKAQSLRDGFERRLTDLRTHLSDLHPRIQEAPKDVRGRHKRLAEVMKLMLKGFSSMVEAFIHYGRSFHDKFEKGLC